MKFQTVTQALEALEKYQRTMAAYNHALGIMFHDASTVAPSDSWEGRGKTMEIMSQITYDLETAPENVAMIEYLEGNADALTPQQRRQVEVLRNNYDQMLKVPA